MHPGKLRYRYRKRGKKMGLQIGQQGVVALKKVRP
jgi:hypothetical protein